MRLALVEKRPSLAAHTTSKAVSCFRAQWDDPDLFYLMKNSIEVYENYGQITGLKDCDIGLHRQGWLFASAQADGPGRFGRWIEGQRRLGLTDSELLSGDEARSRFPFLSVHVTAATFRARDGWLSPYEVATGFVRASRADTLFETNAIRIVSEGGRVTGIDTDRGVLFAPMVAVCAGPHSIRFAETMGISLPVKLVRRQRAFVSPRAEIPADAPMVADDDTGAYWRPEPGGPSHLAGSAAFLGWAQDEPAEPPLDEVSGDSDFGAVAMDACGKLTPFWHSLADSFRASEVQVAAGQYSITPDGKPLIGGVPDVAGLYFLTGDNGFGIESGPQAARHLLRLMQGDLVETQNPFRLDRDMRPGRKLVL
jgi:glycine/D-amino acid oxidase-like deaminating enzyme